MNQYNCVDVSEHNGTIDWEAAAEDDVRYAFIRAGFGQDIESQDDKYFHINMQNAIEAGVKVGVYFYSYATNADMAAGEAEHCIRLIEPYKDKISFPIFYDIEEERIESHLDEIVPAFINTMNKAGYNAGVYLTTSWFDDYFKDIWQYTSKGSVHGIGYDCVDCDILYNENMKLLMFEPPEQKEVNITVKVSAPDGVIVNINVEKEN